MRGIQRERGRPMGWTRAVLLGALFSLAALPYAAAPDARSDPKQGFKDLSDQDKDGDIDINDVKLFAKRKLEKDYKKIDWEDWLKNNLKWSKHYYRLFAFIREYYEIDSDPLALISKLESPSRLACGKDGVIWVADPKVGSVFRLDQYLKPDGELGGFQFPVGMAFDSDGNLFVSDAGTLVVEEYTAKGKLVKTYGKGLLKKPLDLALDSDKNLYVADAEADVVWVFDDAAKHIGTLRQGGLDHPMGVAVHTRTDTNGDDVEEVYVIDRKNYRIRVFSPDGTLKRSFGGFPESSGGGMMGGWGGWGGGGGDKDTKGKFVRPQSLLIDSNGKLHVLDTFLLQVQILDPVTGEFSLAYGTRGTDTGEFELPVDIVLNNSGKVLVSDPGLRRVEVIR